MAHQAIQGIDFSNQMAFAQSPNGGIARQGSYIFATHCYQGSLCTHPGRSCSRFETRMTRANNNNIILFHVKHSLSDAEGCEDYIQIIFRTDSAK